MSNPNPNILMPELDSINTLVYINHRLKKKVEDVYSRILVYGSFFLKKMLRFFQYSEEIGRPVVLTKRSRPAEVKMWLENKAFNKM